MPPITPHAYCHSCGLQYRPNDNEPLWPKHCAYCGLDVWSNPLPVAVAVQPVRDGDRMGLAIARRAIEPALGSWCLLGGHLNNDGETIEAAARREFLEESGLSAGTTIGITGSYTNGKGHVLIAVEFRAIELSYWQTAKLCPENSAFGVIWGTGMGASLGFPIHQRIAEEWFHRVD